LTVTAPHRTRRAQAFSMDGAAHLGRVAERVGQGNTSVLIGTKHDVPTPPIDGSLQPWPDVAEQHDWSALLLGNGLGINVWPGFAYGSLFDHARDSGLTAQDRQLFDGTRNFERALSDLTTAMRVGRILKTDTRPILTRYRSIQVALGHAIREVHPRRSSVPDRSLHAIRAALLEYEWIFTTSYDLIVYWAMGSDGWRPFVDLFKYGGRCEFDPDRADVYADEIPVYFLHGALHLVVGGSGATWKLRKTQLQTLLDQFGQPIDGDAEARPLLVTEGSAVEKLRAIEGNDYLAHALQRLREVDLPTVVFGSSLSAQDDHLVEALNEQPDRPVAVSMRPGLKKDVAMRQAEIFGRLETESLVFFDATTHPLGAARVRSSAYP
jgi:uncharacterized protein DUF4917